MDRQTDFTPRSVPAIVLISLALGLLFGGLTLEVAYRSSGGLTATQQEELWHHQMACFHAVDVLHGFHRKEGRWPPDLAELAASDPPVAPPVDGFGRPFRYVRAGAGGLPELISDGLDRRPGGTGQGVDLVTRVPPAPASARSTISVGYEPTPSPTRWRFLRTNAPANMLAGAAVAGLLVTGITLIGFFGDRKSGRTATLPVGFGAWAGLVTIGGVTAAGMFIAAWVIGVFMALVHGWAGPH